MFGLYDNKALFPLFGYEGSSWEYGGYVKTRNTPWQLLPRMTMASW